MDKVLGDKWVIFGFGFGFMERVQIEFGIFDENWNCVQSVNLQSRN